jgi:internalin A
MEDWVQRKIEQARVERWKRLGLGNAGLTNIPRAVCELEELECLLLGRRYYDDEQQQWRVSENSGSPNHIEDIPEQIAQLTNLTSLDLSGTNVREVRCCKLLTSLILLDLSGNNLGSFPDWVLHLPRLKILTLYGSSMTNIPVELLGTSVFDNCLPAIRAHFADQKHGTALDRDLKLLVLGNGRVGKTSLIKRLIFNDFDPQEVSTHAIQMYPWTPEWDEAAQLTIWDFGGQDIYHGTHALFLRSRAVFLIVWDRESDQQPGYQEDEFFFAHFPRSYWLDYVREASPDSAVILVENKCDTGVGSGASLPTVYPQLPFSAKTGYGRATLLGAIRDACEREFAALGARTIGIGRWHVKQTLLEYRKQDEARAPADKRHRTISYQHFQELCDAQHGRVTSARELLRYLHNTGVVYHQEDLFHNQIILDQRWAIEAIYTIFHREKSYRQLTRRRGRFYPSDLHDWAWQEQNFTPDEQRLFLSFMESCALCFRLGDWNEPDPEYIAPDLLPDAQEYDSEIAARRERHGEAVTYYRYTHPFLHQGVMRRFLVTVGRLYRGPRTLLAFRPRSAHRWRPRALAYAVVTGAQSVDGKPAWGSITIEVRGHQRQVLLARIRNEFARLAPNHEEIAQAMSLDGHDWVDLTALESARDIGKVHSQQGTVLETQPLLAQLHTEPGVNLRDDAPYAGEEKIMSHATIYISYAWGDAQERGTSREAIVNRLHDALSAEGYTLKRDKMDLGYKGLISEFVQEIGRGHCIVVVISDKYLKSPFCMYELLEISKNPHFRDRICPIVLGDAKVRSLPDRLEYVAYWKEEATRIEQLIERVGIKSLSAEGGFKEYEKYRLIAQNIDPLLSYVANMNTLTPELLEANDFASLKQAIDARLQQLR